jgi:hypothetical protein
MGLTDLIVGFPGETAEDFEETLSLVRGWNSTMLLFSNTARRDTCGKIQIKLPGDKEGEMLTLGSSMRLGQRNTAVQAKGSDPAEGLVGGILRVWKAGPDLIKSVFEGNERHRGQLLDLKIVRMGSFTPLRRSAT